MHQLSIAIVYEQNFARVSCFCATYTNIDISVWVSHGLQFKSKTFLTDYLIHLSYYSCEHV